MKPIGTLMIEHRLIERMLHLIRREMQIAQKKREIDVAFLDTVVDFIRWYADRTHHAKEEAILFRDVAKKQMSPADRELLEELIADHDYGRRTISSLVVEKERYLQDSGKSVTPCLEIYEKLTSFYQEHIRKEDHIFFPASLHYFTEQEQLAMVQEFWESDRRMIHKKYENGIEALEHVKQ